MCFGMRCVWCEHTKDAPSDRQEVLAVNAAVADDVGSRFDVGAERARRVFESKVQSLSANQLVATEGTSLDTVRAHRLMQGEQAAGQPAVTRVKEYFFEMPATVGGIEVFGAGTTVAVHRSGQLASIRSVGPVMGLSVGLSVGASPTREMITRVVPTEALGNRAATDHPGATVVPLGLRYPWQATSDAALAGRPREAFQIIPTTEVGGQKVKGRAHYVFYSVESERVAPMVWPQPNPGATDDERK
jgi:hypothetical protein